MIDNQETILLVDDDKEFCLDFSRLLEGHGYHVQVAYGISRAMKLVRTKKIKTVIIDLKLGESQNEKFRELNGLELFIHIRKFFPCVKRIIVSGLFIDQIIEHSELSENDLLVSEVKESYVEKGILDEMEEKVISKINSDTFLCCYGKYHALLIAAQEYSFLKTLTYPIADIQRLQSVLTEHFVFDQDRIYPLINPTREKIICCLFELAERIKPEDNFLIFYAGHGYKDEKNNRGYWMPCDSSEEIPHTWISHSDVRNWIARIGAKHTLLISDSCFSGTFHDIRGNKSYKQDYQEIYDHTSYKVISTTGQYEIALDQSPFLECFLDYLEEDTKPCFSAHDMVDFFTKVEAKARELGVKQRPKYGKLHGIGRDEENGHFIFVRRT